MRALETWAVEVAPSIVKGSPLGKAWTYLDNQWERLQVFLTDGNVSISNDAAERGLRRITIGRKLWLFFQNDKNAEWAASIASLMATARLHGANELEYITWLLREISRREWSPETARCLARCLADGAGTAEGKQQRRGVMSARSCTPITRWWQARGWV